MKKSPALIQFDPSILSKIDTHAKTLGVSRNATVNIACSQMIGECERLRTETFYLQSELTKLRQLLVKVTLAKGGFEL